MTHSRRLFFAPAFFVFRPGSDALCRCTLTGWDPDHTDPRALGDSAQGTVWRVVCLSSLMKQRKMYISLTLSALTQHSRTRVLKLTNYQLRRLRALSYARNTTVHCTVDCTLRPHTGSPDGTHRHAASAHRAHALEATRRRSVEEVYTGARSARVSWARPHARSSACPSRRRRS